MRYLEDCVAKLKSQAAQSPNLGPAPTTLASGDMLDDISSSASSVMGDPRENDNPVRDHPRPDPSGDIEMSGSGNDLLSPVHVAPSRHLPTSTAQRPSQSNSPAVLPVDSSRRASSSSSSESTTTHRHNSYSSDPRHFSFSSNGTAASAATSPSFGPVRNGRALHQRAPGQGSFGDAIGSGSRHAAYVATAGTTLSAPGSTLASPHLAPQRDQDHEASAALLMLNQDSGRRKFGPGGGAGGKGIMSVRDLLAP